MNVVVTAGASGIGLAIAQRFLADSAEVHICDVASETLDRALKNNAGLTGAVADVSDPAQVERLFARRFSEAGSIDVLVNNAGISGPHAKVEDIAYGDWDRCIRTNLSGMFYSVKQVVPAMKAQRKGCIINIATASATTGLPERLPYVASKVGVLGLTHNLARELGPFNIRCNCILPGLIDNERMRGVVARVAAAHNRSVEQQEHEFLRFVSMRTWIQPSEVANVAAFLASDAARHITGQEISVDGNVEWEE